jgi:DNA-binding NarL/FixJ family response regulator
LIVDEDTAFRSRVADLLEEVGYATKQLASGAEVLSAAAHEEPALVILDVQLSDRNGYEVCRELRDAYGESISIVFVSDARVDALDRSAGFLVGGDDYLAKPIDDGEFIARVRRLLERPSNGLPHSSTARLGSLTPREHEVLGLLSEGYRQEEIAQQLVISPKTVSTHIQRILGKLEVRSRAQAVALALREL